MNIMCESCPFNNFSESSEEAQNLGRLPDPNFLLEEAIRWKNDWPCHSHPELSCKGFEDAMVEEGFDCSGRLRQEYSYHYSGKPLEAVYTAKARLGDIIEFIPEYNDGREWDQEVGTTNCVDRVNGITIRQKDGAVRYIGQLAAEHMNFAWGIPEENVVRVVEADPVEGLCGTFATPVKIGDCVKHLVDDKKGTYEYDQVCDIEFYYDATVKNKLTIHFITKGGDVIDFGDVVGKVKEIEFKELSREDFLL